MVGVNSGSLQADGLTAFWSGLGLAATREQGPRLQPAVTGRQCVTAHSGLRSERFPERDTSQVVGGFFKR